MIHNAVLIISDNEFMLTEFMKLLQSKPALCTDRTFSFACHPKNEILSEKDILGNTIKPLNIKLEHKSVIENFDLVISAHCKQLFPTELVTALTCINIHPGYNPYNRGWYPQVFSILNDLPLGATIHLIDNELDHGAIIDHEQIEVFPWDTSLSAYERVQKLEVVLLERNLPIILDASYETKEPQEAGNINYKKDFESICEIDLDQQATYKEVINKLRALSHQPFKNAYFIDAKTKSKIWVNIELEKDDANK